MKKITCAVLIMSVLASLSACSLFSPAQTEEATTFDASELTEIESEVDTTTDTTEEEFEHTSSSADYEYDEVDVPAPISAVWGNKKVTLECDIVTDIRWPSDMGVIYYKNDYAVFCNYGKYSEPIDYETLGFNVLDKNGNIVLAENLQNLSDFDSNGIAKVHYENKLDKFYYINLKGERIDKEAYDGYNVTGPEQADCEALGIRHEGVGRYYIGETEVNHIGNNYNGLIPFLVGLPDSSNSLLGLMDTDLNIVIPATMEVYLPYHLGFYISEDRLVVNLDGRIAILKLTVEETLETEEGTLEDQALSLTTHIVRYAMTSDWLEGKLEFTDERMTQFVYALATLDEDDADHPYSDLSATLVENGHSYGLLEKEKAERALLEVFGEDVTFPLDKDNSMIVDGYIRVPHEVGFSTTMYHPKDMTARVDGDLVRVTCSLEYEDRADFEVDDIGDYELVYKLIRDGEREYLRLDSINRINNPEKLEFGGIYNGSEITMTLTLTEYNFPSCMYRPVGFENGYTTLCYHGKRGEENVCQARALFDKNGKMVVEPIYDTISTVSPDGKVVAYLANNEEDRGKLTGNAKPYLIDLKNNTMTLITEEELTAHRLALENNTSETINPEYSITGDFSKAYDDYTVLDEEGNECYTFKDAYNAYFVSDETIWCLQDGICALYDAYGKRLSPECQHIGIFENGLAAFVADGKLGIISDKGEVIIPAQIEVQDRFVAAYPPSLWLNEGLILVNVDGILGIIEIVRK